jgi:hypothetical protein
MLLNRPNAGGTLDPAGGVSEGDPSEVGMGDPVRQQPSKLLVFAKGGAGCLVAFLAIGAIVLTVGGTVFLDFGGAILLFVIGGIIGLIVNWIYQRGRRDADRRDPQGPTG